MKEEIANILEETGTGGSMAPETVLRLVRTFNKFMLGNVDGPDCTDRETCSDNCCSIMIDVPTMLARKYIEEGRLQREELLRGDVFSWKLGVNQSTNRCVFYSRELHGCRAYVEDLDTRPPQCAVYPAGYTAGAAKCKSHAGPWVVKDVGVGNACKQLMDHYKEYCLEERKLEREKEEQGLTVARKLDETLRKELKARPPSSIAGIKDTWDGYKALLAEGKSFSMKWSCDRVDGCTSDFITCTSCCNECIERVVSFLKDVLPRFIQKRDMQGTYTLLELKNFNNRT